MIIRRIADQLKTYLEWKLRPVKAALNAAYVTKTVDKYWQILPQWNSALFTDSVTYRVEKILNPLDPMKVKIQTRSKAVFNKWTTEMIEAAHKEGLPIEKFTRTGGPFQTNVQTKTNARFLEVDLIEKAQALFRMPEYLEGGVHERHVMLLQQSWKRTLENLAKIKDNGALAIVGKLPTVSTGWGSPIKTRGDLAVNLAKVYDEVVREINEFYEQLIAAVKEAPADGCDIVISGLFHGVLKGVRDDADVEDATPDLTEEVIVAGTRKTGVVPSSMAHNPGLDPALYRKNEIFARYATEYTMLPFENETIVDIISHPLANMPGDDPEEIVWCSFDIGFQENAPRYTNRLEIPDPGRTLGADTIMMAGKLLKVNYEPEQEQYIIAMLESGAEFTSDWYLVLVGMFAVWAKNKGLTKQDFRYMNIGDDFQLLIKRKHLGDFLARFGPWMKAKGMREVQGIPTEGKAKTFYAAFLVGLWIAKTTSEPGKIYAWVSPRHVKTTPGPKVKELMAKFKPDHGPYLEVGEDFTLETPEEQKTDVAKYWEAWKPLVYYFGPQEDYLQLLKHRGFWYGRWLASQLGGGSEWLEDQFNARDMGTLAPKEAKPVEPNPPGKMASRTLAPETGVTPGVGVGDTSSKGISPGEEPEIKKELAAPPKEAEKQKEPEAEKKKDEVPADKAPLVNKVTGPHYHLPPDGKRVVTLADSGRTPEQYAEDKKTSNPKFQTPGKDHADWPVGIPLPDASVIYDEHGVKGGGTEPGATAGQAAGNGSSPEEKK